LAHTDDEYLTAEDVKVAEISWIFIARPIMISVISSSFKSIYFSTSAFFAYSTVYKSIHSPHDSYNYFDHHALFVPGADIFSLIGNTESLKHIQ
jgi:hypothetical protein